MVKIKEVKKDAFQDLHKEAYQAIFKDSYFEHTFTFALLAVNEKEEPTHYFTVLENTKDSCYVCFGGTLPDFRGKGGSFLVMNEMVDYLLNKYSVIQWCTKNDNIPMLKFGIQKGFKIIGLEVRHDGICLEHRLEK